MLDDFGLFDNLNHKIVYYYLMFYIFLIYLLNYFEDFLKGNYWQKRYDLILLDFDLIDLDNIYLLNLKYELFLDNKAELDSVASKVVYTGPIDAYFGYKLGALEYRSVRFETEILDIPDFQGNAVVNYTDRETPFTRIIEHKWFEFGKDDFGRDIPKTVVSKEYSYEWKQGEEPYYPINDEKNQDLYLKYKKLAEAESNVLFGGRLGEYKYYDMDAVIDAALVACSKELKK